MSNRRYFFVIAFLMLNSCTSVAKHSIPGAARNSSRLNEVSLGETKEKALSILGQPKSKSFEELQVGKYEVWSYENRDGLPLGFLSMAPESDRVAGRAIWILDNQPEKDLSYVETQIFPKVTFEKFKTCDPHWGTTFLVSRQHGILVGLRRNEVFMIEWVDATLANLRIRQLSTDCTKPKR
jgi:hypothetical protein